MRSKTIYASNIEFLNDATENKRIWELVQSEIDRRIKSAAKDEQDELKRLKKSLVQRHEHMEKVFVACFSEQRDLLSQWRAYGRGYGYAIGFWGQKLAELATPKNSRVVQWHKGEPTHRFAQVLYASKKDIPRINGLIDQLLFGLSESDGFSEPFPHYVVRNQAPLVKDSAFESEQEWRLLALIDGSLSGLTAQVKYRPGRSHLIPFFEVPLKGDFGKYFTEIVVGPGPSRDLDVLAVRELVQSLELDITVNPSDVPFRNW
jgi:hypothetical protein